MNCSAATPQYFPEKSATAKDQRKGDRIEFGVGGVNMTGEYFSDNLVLAGKRGCSELLLTQLKRISYSQERKFEANSFL
jgi:hypothetical protein